MATVNFSDTTPGAPTNQSNVLWQSDVNGNVSAYWSPGGWANWTPAYSGGGTMVAALNTLYDAQFIRIGAFCSFKLACALNLSGTASNNLSITLPLAVVGSQEIVVSAIGPGGASYQPTYASVNSGLLTVFNIALANFTTPSTVGVNASGSYRVV